MFLIQGSTYQVALVFFEKHSIDRTGKHPVFFIGRNGYVLSKNGIFLGLQSPMSRMNIKKHLREEFFKIRSDQQMIKSRVNRKEIKK